MSRPVRWFRITPAKCEELPAVKEAYDTLPGFALAQEMNSARLLAGTLACTAITKAAPRKLVTGLKFLSGS